MKPIVYKTLTWFVLPVVIILISWAIVHGIMEPVKFNKEKAQREEVGIQRLKDIRTIQAVYKSAKGYYAPKMDTLIDFYNNGSIKVVMQVGSMDDSVAVAHTEAVKKANKKITAEELYNMYLNGDKHLIVMLPKDMAVKDTLFNGRKNFDIENLRYIPFSDGDEVIMNTIVKQVSGVDVPLFEAKMPFTSLLKGMDHQLTVNLIAEREDTGRYPGWMVGSIDNPNNNAGNWE